MYPHQARVYGAIIPGSEFIRSLVRQGTITKGGGQEAAMVRLLQSLPERPQDLPLLRHLSPDVLSLEGAV